MKKQWLVNAFLLIAVAAVAAIAYFAPWQAAEKDGALATLRAADASRIRIERGDAPAIELEKRDDRWLLTAPLAAPADAFQVERLLAILGARSSGRLPAVDLARFGLDPPRVRLTVDGQTYAFGAINEVMREQYVLAAGAVHAVELRYGAAVPTHVSALIAKQLLDADEVPVRFETRSYTVALEDGRWRISPAAGDPGQDDLNRWVDGWRHALALSAAPHDDRPVQEEVRIALKDGRRITVGVVQREPEFVMRRPDRALQYVFATESAKRLLMPPGSPGGDKKVSINN